MAKTFFPFMPDWTWDEEAWKKQWADFEAVMGKLMEQGKQLQEDAMNARKEQWDQFFAHVMEMEQTVVDFLPDEKISIPGMPESPLSPREFATKVKEFQENANTRAVEQAENRKEQRAQQQEKAMKAVSDAVENIKENAKKAKAK